MQSGRKVYLDYARVLAIISISCNHAINRSFPGFESSYNAFLAFPRWVTVFRAVVFVFSRVGVPVFLMISGALLLNKRIETKEDILRFYKHNLGGLVITSEIWIFLNFLVHAYFNKMIAARGILYTLARCLGCMLFIDQTQPDLVVYGSIWYIPMIICVYLLIPFVNILLHKYATRLMLIPAALVAVSAMILPGIRSILAAAGYDISIEFRLSAGKLFSFYLLFVIVGFYVANDALKKLSKTLVTFLALFTLAILCAYQYWEYTTPTGWAIEYESFLLLLHSGFLFESLRRFIPASAQNRGVTYIAKISFAIYFVHIFIMSGLVIFLPRFGMGGLHPAARFCLLEAVSFLGSIPLIAVFSKIPLFKKYVFLIKD